MMSKFGNKSFHKYALGIKSGVNSGSKFGMKMSGLGTAAGAIASATGNFEVGVPLIAASGLVKQVSSGLERATR